MAKRTEDSWIKSNEEYTKLKGERVDGEPPRELPDSQAPGKRGHERPDYSRWTIDELRALADDLGVEHENGASRDTLIERIESHDAATARSEGRPH